MPGNVLRCWKVVAVLVSSILLSTLCSGMVETTDSGRWPVSWPKELEPYREHAKTIGVHAGSQEDVFEISFRSREQFEKIWPSILTLKSEGAPLTLITAGSVPGWAGLFDNNEPLVRIYARHRIPPGIQLRMEKPFDRCRPGPIRHICLMAIYLNTSGYLMTKPPGCQPM